jgi:hypothetical protein
VVTLFQSVRQPVAAGCADTGDGAIILLHSSKIFDEFKQKKSPTLEQGLQQDHTALAHLRCPVIAPHPALLAGNEPRLPQEA